MAKKSNAKRIERMEGICIGAGFLLLKLQSQFGREFSEGMREQVQHCIQDCNVISRAVQQREAAALAKEAA